MNYNSKGILGRKKTYINKAYIKNSGAIVHLIPVILKK